MQIWSEVFDRLDYCQEFSPGCTLVLLRCRQGFTIVSHHHLATILDLRQHSLHIVVTDISIQNVFLRWVTIRQDGCFHQAIFQVIKCLLLGLCPLLTHPLCCQLIQRLCNSCKVWYVLTIVPYQSQECPQFREVDRNSPVPHGPYLLGVGGDPVSTNNMAQVLHLALH